MLVHEVLLKAYLQRISDYLGWSCLVFLVLERFLTVLCRIDDLFLYHFNVSHHLMRHLLVIHNCRIKVPNMVKFRQVKTALNHDRQINICFWLWNVNIIFHFYNNNSNYITIYQITLLVKLVSIYNFITIAFWLVYNFYSLLMLK